MTTTKETMIQIEKEYRELRVKADKKKFLDNSLYYYLNVKDTFILMQKINKGIK